MILTPLMKKDEFQHMILDLITTDEYKKYINILTSEHKADFEAGFVQGLCWASLLSQKVETIYLKEGDEI